MDGGDGSRLEAGECKPGQLQARFWITSIDLWTHTKDDFHQPSRVLGQLQGKADRGGRWALYPKEDL